MGQISGRNSAGSSALGYQWAVVRMLAELLSHLRLDWGKISSQLRQSFGGIELLCTVSLGRGISCLRFLLLISRHLLSVLAVWSFPMWPLTFSKTVEERGEPPHKTDVRLLYPKHRSDSPSPFLCSPA